MERAENSITTSLLSTIRFLIFPIFRDCSVAFVGCTKVPLGNVGNVESKTAPLPSVYSQSTMKNEQIKFRFEVKKLIFSKMPEHAVDINRSQERKQQRQVASNLSQKL